MWNIERLEIYSRVCDLIPRVYGLIKMLPSEEKFALGSQLRRAVVSIKSNMIEGSGKRTSKEFISYLGNAMGSLKEVRGQIEIGNDLKYFEGVDEVAEIRRIERMLFGYIKYIEKKDVR
jgi:four helix bundle protein